MNRVPYFNYIEEKLHVLASRIVTRGKLNLLDIHLHSENFYLHFFNLLYGYKLENLNSKLQNVEAIDLIDNTNKIIIQVSATCTKQKIESALNKTILGNYPNYSFKFISLSKDASGLRKKTYLNPHSLSFDPSSDIYDILSISNDILGKSSHELKNIYAFIKSELGNDVDVVKLDSNLTSVINILSRETWDEANSIDTAISFEINRKIEFNDLTKSKSYIDEYCVYYKKVDEKYSEFDSLGSNKSFFVLNAIKRVYLRLKDTGTSDSIFLSVIDEIKNLVLCSSNFIDMPIDELELCVDILVVDAFIRCKIFENPQNYNYATSR